MVRSYSIERVHKHFEEPDEVGTKDLLRMAGWALEKPWEIAFKLLHYELAYVDPDTVEEKWGDKMDDVEWPDVEKKDIAPASGWLEGAI